MKKNFTTWILIFSLLTPPSARAGSGIFAPYVFPRAIAPLFTPATGPEDAKTRFSKSQQGITNALNGVTAANQAMSDALAQLKAKKPNLPVINADITAAQNSFQSASIDLKDAAKMRLYSIDEQPSFLGTRLGGEEIPYDIGSKMVMDEIWNGVNADPFGRTDTITVAIGSSNPGLNTGGQPESGAQEDHSLGLVVPGKIFWIQINDQKFSIKSKAGDTTAVILDNLRKQIAASSLPVTPNLKIGGTILTVVSKQAWNGSNYSFSVSDTLSDGVDTLGYCNEVPVQFVGGVPKDAEGGNICKFKKYGADVDIVIWDYVYFNGEATPKVTLDGPAASPKLSLSINPTANINVGFTVRIDLPLIPVKFVQGIVNVLVTGKTSVNQISLDSFQPDEIFLTDASGTPTLNPDHVTLPKFQATYSTGIGGLESSLKEIGVEMGAAAGLIIGSFIPVVGPLFTAGLGALVGELAGKPLAKMIESILDKAIQKALNKALASAQAKLSENVDKQLHKHADQIQQIKNQIAAAQTGLTLAQATIASNLGTTLTKNFDLFKNTGTCKQTIDSQSGGYIYENCVDQELSAWLGIQIPLPGANKPTTSLSGTMIFPRHTCNIGASGGSGSNEQWSVDYGTLGPDEVNADIAGSDCATLLKNELLVSAYRGSAVQQLFSSADSHVVPQWTALSPAITGTAIKKVTSNGAEYYSCDYTVSGLPQFSVVRLALAPKGKLVQRLHLDPAGSSSNSLVSSNYLESQIDALSPSQRNFVFRTALLGPGNGALVAGALLAVSQSQKLCTALAPFPALKPPGCALLPLASGLLSLDELGNPTSQFELGYRGIKDQKNECAGYTENGGTIYDSASGCSGLSFGQCNWNNVYGDGSWN